MLELHRLDGAEVSGAYPTERTVVDVIGLAYLSIFLGGWVSKLVVEIAGLRLPTKRAPKHQHVPRHAMPLPVADPSRFNRAWKQLAQSPVVVGSEQPDWIDVDLGRRELVFAAPHDPSGTDV